MIGVACNFIIKCPVAGQVALSGGWNVIGINSSKSNNGVYIKSSHASRFFDNEWRINAVNYTDGTVDVEFSVTCAFVS